MLGPRTRSIPRWPQGVGLPHSASTMACSTDGKGRPMVSRRGWPGRLTDTMGEHSVMP